jgi:hypothetical protein
MGSAIQRNNRQTKIFVSRLNIYEDGMVEIISAMEMCDPPVKLTSKGKLRSTPRDYGKPRREFKAIILREIIERLFSYCLKDVVTALADYPIGYVGYVKDTIC